MKVVLDTNVFISGVFFTGPPFRILQAWRDGRVDLVLSPEILEEYQEVTERLSNQFAGIDISPILALAATKGTLVSARELPESVCQDPDDDKVISCALAARCKLVISGDKHLLAVSGYKGIQILRPRDFVEEHLT